MNYASALPYALGIIGQQASPADGMKLGDLIGQNTASQVAKLGDLVPPARVAAPSSMLAPPRPGTLGALNNAPLFGEGDTGPVLSRLPSLAGDATLGDLMQPIDPSKWHTKKPKFFSKDGAGPIILAGLADGLTAWSSGGQNQGHALQAINDRNQHEAEFEEQRTFDFEKRAQELAAKREEAMRPRVEQVGNTLGMLNPASQSYSPFYTAPQPFESYAKALGYEPGSPEYRSAVEDYRLGAWSDPAMANKTELESLRYGNRKTLQDERLNVTRRGQDIRSADTRRGQTLADTRGRRGQDMTDKRVRDFHGKKVGGQAVSTNEPMTRLSNGHYAVVRGGRWVDASTGQPVQ